MKKVFVVFVLSVLVAGSVYAYKRHEAAEDVPQVTQLKVSQGDIIETVAATGTLSATRTVEVGTQVSGTVQNLYVDYNSIVKKGEVLARIEPSLIQAQLDSSKASLDKAKTTLVSHQATLANDQLILSRNQSLAAKGLVTQQDLDTAQLTVKQDQAQVEQDQAGITVAQADVDQAQVNLDHTVITSPIDGIVIARNVDQGQTVASSMTTPTLYVLATDLTKIQLTAGIDESDVSRVHPGEDAAFTVDAYENTTFHGSVDIVRLNPQTVSNVVTYQCIIDVDNADLRLKPGMTANLNIEVSRVTNVLRVPNPALRFRPGDDVFAMFGQTPPASGRGTGPGGRGGGRGANAIPGATPPVPPAATAAPAPAAPAKPAAAPAKPTSPNGTIDQLFAPMPKVITNGQVWLLENGKLSRVPVRLGITDGQWTELVSGSLQAGESVVTNVLPPASQTKLAAPSPLMPQRGGRYGR